MTGIVGSDQYDYSEIQMKVRTIILVQLLLELIIDIKIYPHL